jgi:uracil-DNA glycosylase family 4
MKGFHSLLDPNEIVGGTPERTKSSKPSVKKPPKDDKRGCEHCPLNNAKGINKVKGLDRIEGKTIMVWAQNPGREENSNGMELIGPAGKFLWKHGASVGLTREMCDIQNVVRCWTVSTDELVALVPREPSKEEIHCCSIYTEQALERNRQQAKVHLVLGKVAAKALLKGEYRKDQKTFFSERLKGWVILTYHPSYFLRGAPLSKLREFIEALKVTLQKAGQVRGKFAYIEAQDYRPVNAKKLKTELVEPLVASGERVSVDIEDSVVEGENVIICVGFSWKKGMARVVFLDHPELKHTEEDKQRKLRAVKWILENPTIKKVFQHGNYDVDKIRDLLGIIVQGYDHDTQYSEFLRFSAEYSYGLEAIADRRFREFAGYKSILEEYRDPETKQADLWKVPIRTVLLYNGADCDLTKRIEKSNRDSINPTLLKVMIKVAFPLARMEKLGPWFDNKYDKEVLQQWIPQRLELLRARIRGIAATDTFNPNAPAQVAAIIYDKLKLGRFLDPKWKKKHGERSTDKETMQLLGGRHKFPLLIVEYRGLAKIESTYMKGYRVSAELHDGRLRTKWWLTGTITCRLRSGGGKNQKDKAKGIVNLQNIHGDPEIECLLVSDKRWREVYNAWKHQRRDS